VSCYFGWVPKILDGPKVTGAGFIEFLVIFWGAKTWIRASVQVRNSQGISCLGLGNCPHSRPDLRFEAFSEPGIEGACASANPLMEWKESPEGTGPSRRPAVENWEILLPLTRMAKTGAGAWSRLWNEAIWAASHSASVVVGVWCQSISSSGLGHATGWHCSPWPMAGAAVLRWPPGGLAGKNVAFERCLRLRKKYRGLTDSVT